MKKIFLISLIMVTYGCAATYKECREQYPCPTPIIVSPPELEIIDRPILNNFKVKTQKENFIITDEDINKIKQNEKMLTETIKSYEKIIEEYIKWRNEFNKIEEK